MDMLNLVDYSEKSIAVYGDTKEVKNALKAIGGRYNKNLRDGKGWIFSAKKRDELVKFVEKTNGKTAKKPAPAEKVVAAKKTAKKTAKKAGTEVLQF